MTARQEALVEVVAAFALFLNVSEEWGAAAALAVRDPDGPAVDLFNRHHLGALSMQDVFALGAIFGKSVEIRDALIREYKFTEEEITEALTKRVELHNQQVSARGVS